ncbi:MAG: substrate-binding domain-containing protein, partial [Oscillospiraceae bacterium]|nr:substrate-binding domain-containing protein [Oscillospiraceae bacterium]
MRRKTIAVCVTGYNWEYESRVIDGINSRCVELDINLLIFASLIRKPDINSHKVLPESIVQGESEIFNLINYDMLDGVIILGGSIIDEEVVYRVFERCEKHNIPMININDPDHRLKLNVDLSDREAMEFVMRHIVEVHGKRRINFIGGFKGNLQTEERLAAYKKILAEYGIPIEEERIAYGEFWTKAKDCTAEFMKAEQKPEAIVCANDTMAFFCMDYLKDNGFRIPEDVIVTGFDGIKDCEEYDPTLTTVRPSYAESGKTAVDILTRLGSGEEMPQITSVESSLIKNQSCGCCKKSAVKSSLYSMKYKELNDFK